MKNKKKKIISKKESLIYLLRKSGFKDFYFDLDYKTIDDILEVFNFMKDKFGGDSIFHIDIDGSDFDCYCEAEFNLTCFREETDEEFKKRIETNRKKSIAAKKAAETKRLKKIERDKKQLKELLKKYGSNYDKT